MCPPQRNTQQAPQHNHSDPPGIIFRLLCLILPSLSFSYFVCQCCHFLILFCQCCHFLILFCQCCHFIILPMLLCCYLEKALHKQLSSRKVEHAILHNLTFNNPSIFQHLKKSFYFLPFLNLKTCYLQRLQGSDLWSLASLVSRLPWSWLVWSPPCIKGNTKADWWYWLLDWLIYYNKQNLTQKCLSPPSAAFCIVSQRTLSHNPARMNCWWSWSWIMSHHWWLDDDKLMIMVMLLNDDKDYLKKQLVARLKKVRLDEWRTTLDQAKHVNFLNIIIFKIR